jgi:prepilin-type N-terminal cleavage/methylation domain-containing protein
MVMHSHYTRYYARCGFSLIELAVVISIIALVGGLSLSVGTTQVKVTKIRQATQTTDNVKTALLTYVKKAGRYPCPANPALASTNVAYGTEVTGCDAACPAGLICNGNAIEGALPFKTIGLSEAASYDSWDNKLTYVVDKAHVSSSAYGNGSLPVYDAAGNEITASPVLGKAIFLLLSHGSDGKGAYKRDGTLRAACGAATSDSENCDGDGIYRYTSFNDAGNATTTPTYYQDFLSWHTQDKVEEVASLASASLMNVSQTVWVGTQNTCIMLKNNNIQCTGRNGEGEHGVGSTSSFYTFRDVSGGYQFSSIGHGDNNSMAGITQDGRAFVWGKNNWTGDAYSILGINTNTSRRTSPVQVFGNHTDWTQITVDSEVGCGVRNGEAYCWGWNREGNIGNGTVVDSIIPMLVSGGYTDWISISTGGGSATHPSQSAVSCGLRSNGRIYCWGDGEDGKLGNNTWTSVSTPTEVAKADGTLPGYDDWKYLRFNGSATCAIRAEGLLYCWGLNNSGQVGDGTTINKNIPVRIGTFNDWRGVWAGAAVTCAIRGSGLLYCWGRNDVGQVGTGTATANILSPQPIEPAINDWNYASTRGDYHGCAIRSNGALYCWGSNEFGAFGNGTTSTTVAGPTLISGVTVKTAE